MQFSLSAGGCNAAYRYRDGLLAGDRLLVERGNTLRQQIEIKALFIAPTHGHTYRRTDPIGSQRAKQYGVIAQEAHSEGHAPNGDGQAHCDGSLTIEEGERHQ